jgi:phospholipid/cholesterol/gamma-HCH transport system permease protein
MKLTSQIDALKTFAVSPIRYLVVPKFIAALLMLPILTAYTDFIGILGGYLMGVIKFKINSKVYIENSFYLLDSYDLLAGLIKSLFFGMVIITISCYKGLSSISTAIGVRTAATQAVVISSVFILILDYFLTLILF